MPQKGDFVYQHYPVSSFIPQQIQQSHGDSIQPLLKRHSGRPSGHEEISQTKPKKLPAYCTRIQHPTLDVLRCRLCPFYASDQNQEDVLEALRKHHRFVHQMFVSCWYPGHVSATVIRRIKRGFVCDGCEVVYEDPYDLRASQSPDDQRTVSPSPLTSLEGSGRVSCPLKPRDSIPAKALSSPSHKTIHTARSVRKMTTRAQRAMVRHMRKAENLSHDEISDCFNMGPSIVRLVIGNETGDNLESDDEYIGDLTNDVEDQENGTSPELLYPDEKGCTYYDGDLQLEIQADVGLKHEYPTVEAFDEVDAEEVENSLLQDLDSSDDDISEAGTPYLSHYLFPEPADLPTSMDTPHRPTNSATSFLDGLSTDMAHLVKPLETFGCTTEQYLDILCAMRPEDEWCTLQAWIELQLAQTSYAGRIVSDWSILEQGLLARRSCRATPQPPVAAMASCSSVFDFVNALRVSLGHRLMLLTAAGLCTMQDIDAFSCEEESDGLGVTLLEAGLTPLEWLVVREGLEARARALQSGCERPSLVSLVLPQSVDDVAGRCEASISGLLVDQAGPYSPLPPRMSPPQLNFFASGRPQASEYQYIVPRTPHSRSGHAEEAITEQSEPLLVSSASATFPSVGYRSRGDDHNDGPGRKAGTSWRKHLSLQRIWQNAPIAVGSIVAGILLSLIVVSFKKPGELDELVGYVATESTSDRLQDDLVQTPTMAPYHGPTPTFVDTIPSPGYLISYENYTHFPLTGTQYAHECAKLVGGKFMHHGSYWSVPAHGVMDVKHHDDVTDYHLPEGERTKVCSKTITYQLDGHVGLAADLALMAQAAALARERNRTFLIDDTYWNRGKWSDYFQDVRLRQPGPEPGCRAPPPEELVACPRLARHWVINSRTAKYHFGHAYYEEYENAYKQNLNRQRPIYEWALQSFTETIRPNAHNAGLIRSARSELASILSLPPHSHTARNDDINTAQALDAEALLEQHNADPYIAVHIRRGDRHASTFPYRGSYVPLDKSAGGRRTRAFSRASDSLCGV
ncbi:hypothetical protein NM688_g4324 [Phlebia brevispora]|uniref:Uncharacterized protein n=1 Tax=Phlebia brevispora TaxID=194682 RepID=A0ACC1T3F3_9APHY|nr:hypothetical protein NM688_g4324 [Phlebia brevispora]